MSPEQVRSEEVEGGSDLYSFAAVAYEALTGAPVVDEEDLATTFVAVLKDEAPAPSSRIANLPAEVDAAFAAALSKDRADRPADVAAWGESLAGLLEPIPPRVAGWPASIWD